MIRLKVCHGILSSSRLLNKKSSPLNVFLKRNLTSPVSSFDKTDPIPLPWALSSAVCIERVPTLVPPLSELQAKMVDTLGRIEFENSKLSDHELRDMDDKEKVNKNKETQASKDIVIITAVDEEDKWNKELAEFTPASCITEADKNKDSKSTDRCLNRLLYLVVQRKLGNTLHWDLPTILHKGDESMRETAERAVSEHCGSNLKVQILGNAPWAVYKYKYPKKLQHASGKRGEKVFIFKAFYQSGVVEPKELISDFKWSLQEDIFEMLDKPTRTALFDVLYDEEP